MSDDSPIVSHVANRAYREHVDEMTCVAKSCKRWRVDGKTKFCSDHGGHFIEDRYVRADGVKVIQSRRFSREELTGKDTP